ncbi:MAG: UDP-N-acetylmuramate dehydrogenase [Candidatus Paceibacterota bacterium]
MNPETRQKIKELFPLVKEDVPLAPLTTFGLGGKATFYLRVKTAGRLAGVLALVRAYHLPATIMAGGSNIVFADERVDKLIIHYQSFNHARPTILGRKMRVEAGLVLDKVVKISARAGMAGLEYLTDIPGTVGGAIVGNAGAYGQAIADHLVKIEYFDGLMVKTMPAAEAEFAYRHSIFKTKDWAVLAGVFRLPAGDPAELMRVVARIRRFRRKKYEPGLKCPGSFFKNVLVETVSSEVLGRLDQSKIIDGKIPAGYLLEAVGALGRRRGDIAIASFHGNLLFNLGEGTCRDVSGLAAELKQAVWDKFGITLEEEIRYIF